MKRGTFDFSSADTIVKDGATRLLLSYGTRCSLQKSRLDDLYSETAPALCPDDLERIHARMKSHIRERLKCNRAYRPQLFERPSEVSMKSSGSRETMVSPVMDKVETHQRKKNTTRSVYTSKAYSVSSTRRSAELIPSSLTVRAHNRATYFPFSDFGSQEC
jgi:hypothetical protein